LTSLFLYSSNKFRNVFEKLSELSLGNREGRLLIAIISIYSLKLKTGSFHVVGVLYNFIGLFGLE